MTMKINKKMSFSEIIQKKPESIEILLGKGMHCIGCGMAGYETLEQGALSHGLDPDEIVREINGEDKKSSKKKPIKKRVVKKTSRKK